MSRTLIRMSLSKRFSTSSRNSVPSSHASWRPTPTAKRAAATPTFSMIRLKRPKTLLMPFMKKTSRARSSRSLPKLTRRMVSQPSLLPLSQTTSSSRTFLQALLMRSLRPCSKSLEQSFLPQFRRLKSASSRITVMFASRLSMKQREPSKQ